MPSATHKAEKWRIREDNKGKKKGRYKVRLRQSTQYRNDFLQARWFDPE